jgi:hypothetical protein
MLARHPRIEPAMRLDAPDQPRLRDAPGTFATDVTVVTCRATYDGGDHVIRSLE